MKGIMEVLTLSFEESIDRYFKNHNLSPYQKNYLSFYSSYLGGITTDPRAFLIPIDDHMAHRGDAVFEAFKSSKRKIHLLDMHLDRLFRSAENIFLKVPYSKSEIKNIIIETARAANNEDLIFRLFVSRGPGGFAANPYEPLKSQFYLVALKLTQLEESKFENGVTCGWSSIPQKEKRWATTKSCNYLSNVMMKKESVDRGLDFTIALDENNTVAESATENIIIVDCQKYLRIPPLANILSGTMMLRLFNLVKVSGRTDEYDLKGCLEGPISKEELFLAKEVMIVSTTCDVLGVTQFEGQPIADGKVGKYARLFRNLLVQDQFSGPLLTEY
jgi:branched-chain amino acid aminotransferase